MIRSPLGCAVPLLAAAAWLLLAVSVVQRAHGGAP
ncbi:hypothetical protein RKD44_005279 [Streptomyces collinus]